MTKNYSQNGIGNVVQFGKGGTQIKSDTTEFTMVNTTDSALVNLNVASPTQNDHAVTKEYLEDSITSGVFRSVILANGINHTFTFADVLPVIAGKSVYVSRIILAVNTIFDGNMVKNVQITDGVNILASVGDSNIEIAENYIVDLPMLISSNTGDIVVRFLLANGTTSSIPTSGQLTLTTQFNVI